MSSFSTDSRRHALTLRDRASSERLQRGTVRAGDSRIPDGLVGGRAFCSTQAVAPWPPSSALRGEARWQGCARSSGTASKRCFPGRVTPMSLPLASRSGKASRPANRPTEEEDSWSSLRHSAGLERFRDAHPLRLLHLHRHAQQRPLCSATSTIPHGMSLAGRLWRDGTPSKMNKPGAKVCRTVPRRRSASSSTHWRILNFRHLLTAILGGGVWVVV